MLLSLIMTELVPAKAAAVNAVVKGQSTADMAVQLVQVLFSLGLIVGLIFALAWLVKRHRNFSLPQKNIHIIERLSLGAKEQLVLVEIDGERLLLGVNAGGIAKLHTYSAPAAEANASATAQTRQQGPEFSTYLARLLQQKAAS